MGIFSHLKIYTGISHRINCSKIEKTKKTTTPIWIADRKW